LDSQINQDAAPTQKECGDGERRIDRHRIVMENK